VPWTAAIVFDLVWRRRSRLFKAQFPEGEGVEAKPKTTWLSNIIVMDRTWSLWTGTSRTTASEVERQTWYLLIRRLAHSDRTWAQPSSDLWMGFETTWSFALNFLPLSSCFGRSRFPFYAPFSPLCPFLTLLISTVVFIAIVSTS